VEVISSSPVWIKLSVLVDVKRYIENIWIALKNVLNAISVMYVPVQNQDLPAFFREVVLAHFGCDTNVVEEAESSWLVMFRVMSGRSDDRYGIFNMSSYDCSTSLNCSTSREQGTVMSKRMKVHRVHLLASCP
jgi:hypothetical protein